MSNKNKTLEELERQTKRYVHNLLNTKNPNKFRKLKRRKHGVGKHRR